MANYIEKLPNDAVQITGSLDYIDPRGNVYGKETRHNNPNKGKFFIKAQNKVHGYCYCGIKYPKGNISKRVHKLVATAFIPNPHNFPIVMHKDNNKSNNNVWNLKWGTISESTKQAVNDGLFVNDKSWEDSQSMSVDQYDTTTNKLIGVFGSAKEAERITGISSCTILFQCYNKSDKIRKKTYFVFHNDPPRKHNIVAAYDMVTDKEVMRFANTRMAEEYYNTSHVSDMIYRGKPKWSKLKVWFANIEI